MEEKETVLSSWKKSDFDFGGIENVAKCPPVVHDDSLGKEKADVKARRFEKDGRNTEFSKEFGIDEYEDEVTLDDDTLSRLIEGDTRNDSHFGHSDSNHSTTPRPKPKPRHREKSPEHHNGAITNKEKSPNSKRKNSADKSGSLERKNSAAKLFSGKKENSPRPDSRDSAAKLFSGNNENPPRPASRDSAAKLFSGNKENSPHPASRDSSAAKLFSGNKENSPEREDKTSPRPKPRPRSKQVSDKSSAETKVHKDSFSNSEKADDHFDSTGKRAVSFESFGETKDISSNAGRKLSGVGSTSGDNKKVPPSKPTRTKGLKKGQGSEQVDDSIEHRRPKPRQHFGRQNKVDSPNSEQSNKQHNINEGSRDMNGYMGTNRDQHNNPPYARERDNGSVERRNIRRGDIRDGDVRRGDIMDGDVRRGDIRDGDIRRGDIRDGDVRHSDIRDGDIRRGDIRDGDVRHGDIRHGDIRRGDIRRGDIRDGDTRQGDMRDGDVRQGDIRDGDVRQGDIRDGDVRRGDIRDGDVRQGHIRGGDVRRGDIRDGDVRQGHIRDGDIRRGDIRDGDVRQGHIRDGSEIFEEHVPHIEGVLKHKDADHERRGEGRFRRNTPLKAEKRLEEMTKSPELYNNFQYESRDVPHRQQSPRDGMKRSSSLNNLNNAQQSVEEDGGQEGWQSIRSDLPSSKNIRETVYNDWLQKKQHDLKEKAKKNLEAKKNEEEKEIEKLENQKSGKKAYEAWNSRKEELLKKEAKKKKELQDKEIDEKRERVGKQKDAKKFFEAWKSRKDKLLEESVVEKKTKKKEIKEKEDIKEKTVFAKKSYDKWKQRKDEHIKEEVKSKRKGELLKTKYEIEAEMEKRHESEKAFQEFLNKKGTTKRRPPSPNLTQRAWCPGGLTKGTNHIPQQVQPVLGTGKLNRSRSFGGTTTMTSLHKSGGSSKTGW